MTTFRVTMNVQFHLFQANVAVDRHPGAGLAGYAKRISGQPCAGVPVNSHVSLKEMKLDIHSYPEGGHDFEVAHIAMPTTLQQWKGDQALVFDDSNELMARLAGGTIPIFQSIPLLHFVRGPSWEVAFQVKSEGMWTNFLYATG